jgi:hypothetical protein
MVVARSVTIPIPRHLVKSSSHIRTGALVTPSEGLMEKLNIKGMGASKGYRFLSGGTIQ